jgi:hypothetical protein
MPRSQTVVIEFPIQTRAYSDARQAVDSLTRHLSSGQYRVERLVRVGNALVEATSPFISEPKGYAYRIHFHDISTGTWSRLQRHIFQPLTRNGLDVRAA